MSSRNDIDKRLVYTCNCGWIDKGHASGKSPGRPYIGAEYLWDQILHERGMKSEQGGGFKLSYAQDMKKLGMTDSYFRSYYVKYGLTVQQKESIALAVFMEVSIGFESLQDSWPYSWFTDSGFSVEDLVSDLFGFYAVVRPKIDYMSLCKPVSKDASLKVWDTYGSVGSKKNNTFRPVFYPCEECKKAGITPSFPAELMAIKPATKGTDFRDWKLGTTSLFYTTPDADELMAPEPVIAPM
ncbi:MAG: hypothetical protein IT167_28695 [Bryobacterales bacterium]|nr:hypothetical protein [Bryobacterales bacterium]